MLEPVIEGNGINILALLHRLPDIFMHVSLIGHLLVSNNKSVSASFENPSVVITPMLFLLLGE
jgi:hypothetical protein